MSKDMNSAHSDRILVVDDTTANLQLLTNLLTKHGYTVHPASDGELALEFVQSTIPDLIMLDIRMPGMDGYEVCRRLKENERTESIPVIFISILEDERDKVKGFKAGAVDYITKPFHPEEVLVRVGTHLRLRELTGRLEQKVGERTKELHEQTVMLEQEIAERQSAQEALAVKQFQLESLNDSLQERIDASIAELRQKDLMLIHQSRLASMGEMITNIAHQWRQPLNNVGLIIQKLRMEFDAGTLTSGAMANDISSAMDAILFMSHTIDDFRNFFRQDKEKSAFSINRTIDKILELIKHGLISHGIGIEFEEREDVIVQGYANEYSQVLLNIINNSKDILVNRNISNSHIKIRVSRENGRSVVTIRDNGGGIDIDILPKIFDPYFTTKHQSQGTGIGLYMSKVIIEQNMGGRLTACNVEGGAEFGIEL